MVYQKFCNHLQALCCKKGSIMWVLKLINGHFYVESMIHCHIILLCYWQSIFCCFFRSTYFERQDLNIYDFILVIKGTPVKFEKYYLLSNEDQSTLSYLDVLWNLIWFISCTVMKSHDFSEALEVLIVHLVSNYWANPKSNSGITFFGTFIKNIISNYF